MRLIRTLVPDAELDDVVSLLDENDIDYVPVREGSDRGDRTPGEFPLPTQAVESIPEELQDVMADGGPHGGRERRDGPLGARRRDGRADHHRHRGVRDPEGARSLMDPRQRPRRGDADRRRRGERALAGRIDADREWYLLE